MQKGGMNRLLMWCGLMLVTQTIFGQIDPMRRNLLQLGYDQPLVGRGPYGVYSFYYYNDPEFRGTNIVLRAVLTPVYLDSELGFKGLISPYTDFGINVGGGAFYDNLYDVQQGNFVQSESFNGYGGGMTLGVYQLLNPGMLIPLNAVLRGGIRYTTYADTDKTAENFDLPPSRFNPYVRVGLRLAGKEPVLFPDLGLELSVWYERQWRSAYGPYGFAGDRTVEPEVDWYWVYAGMNYAWTNTGHRISFAVTAGGSGNTDQFSAWRLGGVLPLIAEFPLGLPGYFYQELTAERMLHLQAGYFFPLSKDNRFQFSVDAASARVDYLPGYEQPRRWQTGVGCGVMFTPKSQVCRIMFRYGYGFNAIRDGEEGSHSLGLLFQYDFEKRSQNRRAQK